MKNFLHGRRTIIGMIHVDALPGTPAAKSRINEIVAKAKAEAGIYADAGVDAIEIENMHDTPYVNRTVGPEITAAMAVAGFEVKSAAGLPCGVQILSAANKEALAAALAAGLDFIRAEAFVFGHIGDEGYVESCAGELLRYRKSIGADEILVLTDVKKKHSSHAVTSDVDIAETARAAEFFLSDGVIVTGTATAREADPRDVKAVKAAVSLPVLVGSGITIENVENYLDTADGLIIGSHFKKEGRWHNAVDPERVRRFMEKVRKRA